MKKLQQIDIYKKQQKVWAFNPTTRVKQSKKKYKREKVDWRKEIREED